MGIFDKIKHAIFGEDQPAEQPRTVESSTPISASTTTPISTSPVFVPDSVTTPVVAETRIEPTTPSSATGVDVAALLDQKVKASGQKLDWRKSVVDLMKALGMDASLTERKELADELGYTGDKGDSASMNMWLHKALLRKLSENGGTIPPELLD